MESGIKEILDGLSVDELQKLSLVLKGIEFQSKRSFSREDMQRAFCEGRGIDYNIVVSVTEGQETLDNWLNEFEKE
jgi:hypothetical protein